MRSEDIRNPAIAMPAWVEWRRDAEDFVVAGEAVPLEETVADDVVEGTLPSSILRHMLHETRDHSHV